MLEEIITSDDLSLYKKIQAIIIRMPNLDRVYYFNYFDIL